MIYGTPSLNTEDDVTDRIGIRRIVKSLFWQSSFERPTQEQLDAEAPGIPPMPGGMALVGVQTRRNGGGMKTFWTFEGINGDGKTVTFKTRGNSPDYKFEPAFSERPIQLHPNFADLKTKYKGQLLDDEVIWPDTIQGTGGSSGLTGQSSQKAQSNPMFGEKTYFGIEGTYTYRYCVTDESQVPAIEGKIFEAAELPGRARAFPGDQKTKRNYMGVGAMYQRRGTIIEVIETYWLSRAGGWNLAIYGKGKKAGSGSGGGLTTGGL
jgi:hypothetical protein